MRAYVLVLLAGCGRFGFGEHGPQDAGDNGPFDSIDAPDGPKPVVDVAPLDGAVLSGLVVWFPLDDQPQNTDDVVSGFGGTCMGSQCPSSIAGHRGQALLFDGNDDCVEVPNMGQFGQAQITISVWMRQDNADLCSIVGKPADSVSSTADTWQIETTTTNQINFVSTHGSNANQRIGTADNALVLGQWHHIALTYDGAMKRLYLDSAQVASGAIATALTYDVQSMFIGCDENGGTPAMRFNGAIDEVQIYNRALTLAEIQMLAAM